MSKIQSKHIQVFPAPYRNVIANNGKNISFNPESKLFTEDNLTRLTRNIISRDSYIISVDETSNIYEFCIHGYYFKAKLSDYIQAQNSTTYYAVIGVNIIGTENDFTFAKSMLYEKKILVDLDNNKSIANLDQVIESVSDDVETNYYKTEFKGLEIVTDISSYEAKNSDPDPLNLNLRYYWLKLISYDNSGNAQLPIEEFGRINAEHINTYDNDGIFKGKLSENAQLKTVNISTGLNVADSVFAEIPNIVKSKSITVDSTDGGYIQNNAGTVKLGISSDNKIKLTTVANDKKLYINDITLTMPTQSGQICLKSDLDTQLNAAKTALENAIANLTTQHNSDLETLTNQHNAEIAELNNDFTEHITAIQNGTTIVKKAEQDAAGNNINSTYIKSITINGQKITLTKGNGTTSTISTQDKNLKYNKTEQNADYILLLGDTATNIGSAATSKTTEGNFALDLKYNPSTKTLSSTNLKGELDGNAATATILKTSRDIHVNLASTSAASFNGSSKVTPGITGVLSIANGGTGANTAADVLKNLGIQNATAVELNYCSGVTSNIQAQLDTKQPNMRASSGIKIESSTIKHTNSITAGSVRDNNNENNRTATFGGTFNIPNISYDAQGHITSASTTTVTLPTQTNLTKVNANTKPADTAYAKAALSEISVSNHQISTTYQQFLTTVPPATSSSYGGVKITYDNGVLTIAV